MNAEEKIKRKNYEKEKLKKEATKNENKEI